MTIKEFAVLNQLQPADAVMVKKRNIGMLDHYVVYLGTDSNSNPIFVANYRKGVQYISDSEMRYFLSMMVPKKIIRFQGSSHERQAAIKRALSKIGETDYSLMLNNCEHYANFVQTGKAQSTQSNNAFILGGAALAVFLLSKAFSDE